MNGKTVVITGASSGIGFGVAEAYVGQGANVVLNGRDEAKFTEAAERLGDPQRIAVVPGDIGLAEARGRIVEQGIERFGRIDVLVNNAGHFYPKPFTEYKEEDLDGFLATHLKGTYLTSQAVVPHMRKQGGGGGQQTDSLHGRGMSDLLYLDCSQKSNNLECPTIGTKLGIYRHAGIPLAT